VRFAESMMHAESALLKSFRLYLSARLQASVLSSDVYSKNKIEWLKTSI
jgi:hypothetical protein